ncbi:unnamed protein product [Ilex paraguariensis]|uniref:CASP-like protein n=1 Tax=Ilex paraguariensis TaxID=185542 RepID=A0ABC8UKS5_9AQUA
MAPPPSTVVSPVVVLMVRLLTFICLLISMIILTTNTENVALQFGEVKIRFNDVYAYRYMLATIVIGFAYTLLQTAFTIFQVSTGNRLAGGCLYQFDFYGDKVISYMLATGSAAGFGATIDLRSGLLGFGSFFNKANAAASILLIGFFFSAVSSVFSALALPKRG